MIVRKEKGTRLHSATEEVFKELFASGGVKSVEIRIYAGRAFVHFVLGSGATGQVHTARGKPKGYLVQTALLMLRHLGLVHVQVDMQFWTPDQGSLV